MVNKDKGILNGEEEFIFLEKTESSFALVCPLHLPFDDYPLSFGGSFHCI
jgi:hypothetical protein